MMDSTTDDLFCDLMELPPGERVGTLEAMADLSAGRKAALRRMLKEAEEAEAYFTGTSMAVRILPISSRAEGLEDMCGPYRLIRKLGEGGFGTVWLAEQEKPLKRTVAVKVIKAGMDTDEVLARFDAEKHALARMDHPNIAKVLDAGMTSHGRPYFVMEPVEGKTITSFSEERGLDLGERLRLFADVCSALNHAHQKGVIHRDIKPSNVLVMEGESKPVVKVIDFGIAKAIEGKLSEHTLRTRVEQWIGTPAYMSPEQAGSVAADPDTRSDIYSLGVLLYELITGSAPFDAATLMKAGYEEMRRIIREEEPPRPSARITTTIRETAGGVVDTKKHTVRKASSELDWIVMKAMEKSKERRYESAAALAGDVARYLADEPIEARPPNSWYLLGKFARRHRLGIHIASGFLVLIVGAGLLSVWLALRAHDAEKIAREQLAAALEDRNSKNRALDEAESVSRLLTDVLQRPQPGVDGRSVTVVQALDTAVGKLDEQLLNQPQRQAVLRGVLADTYERLGIFDRSLKLRLRNFEAISETPGANHAVTRQALRDVVKAAENKGDSVTALKYSLMESDALREAAATPEETEAAMRSVIRASFGVGDRKQAIERQRALVEYCGRAFGEDSPPHLIAKWELRQYEARAPRSESMPGNPEETERRLAEISAIEKGFAALIEAHGPSHAETIAARMRLADALLPAGHIIEAQIHLQALQAITMELFGPHDERTLRVQKELVRVYVKLNRRVDAVRIQQAVVNALRDRDGGTAESTVKAEYALDRQLFYSSLHDEYHAYRKDLLQRRIRLFGEEHVNTVMLRWQVGSDGPEDKIRNIQTAIRVMRENHGDNNRSTAEAIAALARTYMNRGRAAEAIKLYAECAPNMLDDTWFNFECATFQLWMGDVEGFRTTRRNIVNYWERRISRQRSSPEMFDRMLWLSCIAELDDERQKNALVRVLEHVESIRAGLHVEAQERFAKPHQVRVKGTVLYRLGRYGDALASFREAIGMKNPGRTDSSGEDYDHPPHWVYFFMAMAEHRLGNGSEAERLFKLGESRLPGSAPCRENPVVKHFTGGEALTRWIIHSEAKGLIFGE